jgi:hypothetical protein
VDSVCWQSQGSCRDPCHWKDRPFPLHIRDG